MKKLARGLKKGFFQMIGTGKCCRTSNEIINEDGQERPKLGSMQQVTVLERGTKGKAARRPTLPGVPRGGGAQTDRQRN
ncbi:hypothetical protein WN943_023702 [Citrus x changshan-huyou]